MQDLQRLFFSSAALLLFVEGCATTKKPLESPSAPSPTAPAEATQERVDFFETPPTFAALDLLDVAEACGELHFVDETVANDGFMNYFALYSRYGDFQARGTERARVRIHEIAVTWELEEMRRTDAGARGFGSGVKDTALGPFRQIRKMLRNPLYVVAAVPSSIFKYADFAINAVGVLRHGVGKEEFKELIGYKDAREDLAEMLRVDPYTSNAALRQELNESAWGFYSGGLPIQIIDDFMPGIPKLDLGDGGMSVGSAIDEIRPSSRSRSLRSMVPERKTRKEFRDHPWYTPETERRLLNGLRQVRDTENAGSFIVAAMGAESEDDAYAFMRTAELIHLYCERVGVPEHVDMAGTFPILRASDGGSRTLLMFADYVPWTRTFAEVIAKLNEETARPLDAVWISGTFSVRARYELEGRGIEITAGAFEEPVSAANQEATGSQPGPART